MTDNISINAHSSIRITGSKVLYFDPFLIEDTPHDADIILITHDHHDHLDPASINKVSNEHTIFIGPESIKKSLRKPAGERPTYFLQPGEEMDLAAISVRAVPAYNRLKPFHPKHNHWVGYVVTMDGIRYYIAGDTDAVKDLYDIQCDIALVPVGGTYTMTAQEAARLVNQIQPKIAVPTHYGSIVGNMEDGDNFCALVDNKIQTVKKLMLRRNTS